MRVWQVQHFDGHEGGEIRSFATPEMARDELAARVKELVTIYSSLRIWVEISSLPGAELQNLGNFRDFTLSVSNAADAVELTGRYVTGTAVAESGEPSSPSLTPSERVGLLYNLEGVRRALLDAGYTVEEGPASLEFDSKWVLRRTK